MAGYDDDSHQLGIGKATKFREGDGLTPLQRRFLDAYAGEADFNPIDALKLAGYKTDGRTRSALSKLATRILTQPESRKYLAELHDSDPLVMSRQERLRMYTRVARGEMSEEKLVGEEIVKVPASMDHRLRALDALGKAQGEGVKIEITIRPEQMSDQELESALLLVGVPTGGKLLPLDSHREVELADAKDGLAVLDPQLGEQ